MTLRLHQRLARAYWLCILAVYTTVMADESSQRSATIIPVVAVRGGGIPVHASLMSAWILCPFVVDGKRFVDIYTREYRCQLYLDGHLDMVKYISRKRNEKVAVAMREVAMTEDTNNFESTSSTGQLSRPRRELIDHIPPVLEIDVETRNGVAATVNVLPSWRQKGVLQIELTKENLDFLLEDLLKLLRTEPGLLPPGPGGYES